MKIEFIEQEGAWIIEFITNSDFNLHLERTNGADDVYVYHRGSSEGEYKLYKRLFGRVIDQDIDIADNIVPKYYRIKCDSQPTLCEVTGKVENVTGVVVPGGGASADFTETINIYHYEEVYDEIEDMDVDRIVKMTVYLDGSGIAHECYNVSAYENPEDDVISYTKTDINSEYLRSYDTKEDNVDVLELRLNYDIIQCDKYYNASIIVKEHGWKFHNGVDDIIDIEPLVVNDIFIPIVSLLPKVYFINEQIGKKIIITRQYFD